jgi:hypothetical protein
VCFWQSRTLVTGPSRRGCSGRIPRRREKSSRLLSLGSVQAAACETNGVAVSSPVRCRPRPPPAVPSRPARLLLRRRSKDRSLQGNLPPSSSPPFPRVSSAPPRRPGRNLPFDVRRRRAAPRRFPTPLLRVLAVRFHSGIPELDLPLSVGVTRCGGAVAAGRLLPAYCRRLVPLICRPSPSTERAPPEAPAVSLRPCS